MFFIFVTGKKFSFRDQYLLLIKWMDPDAFRQRNSSKIHLCVNKPCRYRSSIIKRNLLFEVKKIIFFSPKQKENKEKLKFVFVLQNKNIQNDFLCEMFSVKKIVRLA